MVNLTASFSSLGYLFEGWSGDLSGTSLTPTITMSEHRSRTAVFSQDSGDFEERAKNTDELATHGSDTETIRYGWRHLPF